jgi:hypothetical protein
MKILGIKKGQSRRGHLVHVTDPKLSKEVFHKFLEIWDVVGFDIEHGSLVWTGTAIPDAEFRRQTEIYLTESENHLNAEAVRARNADEDFINKVSESTGWTVIA